MSDFPIPDNEKERLQALDNYNVLNSLSEAEYDRITQLASLICDVPISLISLVDEKRQWFKSKVGLSVSETSRDLAFCQYAIMDTKRFDVEDATKDYRFENNELVTGDPNIRFYSGQPLIDPNGYALGTLCVIDRKPRVLTDAQKKAMEILAEEVMSLIVERRQKEELRNFEKIFNLSNDLIFVGDGKGFFHKINPAFVNVLGWSEEHILKTNSFKFVHPGDVQGTEGELDKLNAGGTVNNFRQRFKTKSGDYKVIQWTSSTEAKTGKIFGVGRDVTNEVSKETQLAVSEEKLRAFFDNSQGFMCTHDLKGNFLSINNAGLNVLGYTREEVPLLNLTDIVPKARRPFIKEYLNRITATGRSSGQMTTLHKDGTHQIWMYNNILETGSDGDEYVIGNGTDITERYYLERDLEQTKQLLEQTNQVARVGGWEVDLRLQKVYWTTETKIIHGVGPDFEPDLTAGINFYREGESREQITAAVAKSIGTGEAFDLELQIITVQGKELWVKTLGYAEFEDGRCRRLYGTFQDIDTRKRTELEVSASKKLLDDVLKAASEVSIIATDTNGLITVFNSGAEKTLGYMAEEMIGKETFERIRLPEEVAVRQKQLSEELGYEVEGLRVFTEKSEIAGSEQREWTAIKKDGEKITVSSVVTPIRDDKDKTTGYLSVATDVTARKKIEQALITEKARLAAFVEHAPAAVAMLDTEMKYVAVSDCWLDMFNFKSGRIIGKSYYAFFPDLSDEEKKRHQRIILQGIVEKMDEEIFRAQDSDADMSISWEMRPWYQYDGKVGGMMISVQDITSVVKHREELKAAILLAEQASNAKSEFLASMSHEIRTPLNGVIGFTDLVLKTNLTETQQQYLNIVNHSANALLSIINDILDFSKIEAGKLELDVEKCDLYELGCQATDIITYQVQTKGLEMLLNISPTLPRFIWADSLRLKQILINLLGNAAKFTETGEIELKIGALGEYGGHTHIRFSVRDTGIGIKPEQQSKIFNAFSQEDASTTKKYGGTGLGLTISNKLLELMDSKLQVDSTPGMGSTFYFDVDLKTEQGGTIEWANIDLIKKVLIVDDNENNRTIISQMLLLKQIKTTQAANGFEALQLLAKGTQFDAIIVDYHIPYLNGLETIVKIRETFKGHGDELPTILLYSSADDGKIIKACEELGVHHRLVKPVKMHDIYNLLSRLHIKEKKIATQPVKAGNTIGDKVKVLIAEDNPVNMLLAKTILKKIAPNVSLVEARSGLEAIDCFKADLPDLIFMDVQMPEMNGYDATKEIRKIQGEKQVPIIALTAGNVKGEKEKCLAVGMDDFVVKPVVEDTIAQVFNKWLNYYNADGIEKEETDAATKSSHFDMSGIMAYIGEDDDFVNEIKRLTKKELETSAKLLETHFNNKDLQGLNFTGHKLYGTTASAGLPILAKLANQLEKLTEFEEAEVKTLIEKTSDEISLVLGILNEV